MQISLSKFSLVLSIVASVGLVVGSLYFLFTVFFGGPKPEVIPVLSASSAAVFGPKLQQATAAIIDPTAKISLDKEKNLKFTTSALYLSFTEDPEVIPLSKIRGRENPFVPTYVTP